MESAMLTWRLRSWPQWLYTQNMNYSLLLTFISAWNISDNRRLQSSVGASRQRISGLLTSPWRETWLRAVVSVRAPSCHVSLHCGGFLSYKHTLSLGHLNQYSAISRYIHTSCLQSTCVHVNKRHQWRTQSSQEIGNFNNFICEKLQAKFINRHFYLKQRKMIRLAYKRKVVHMPETCSILTL